MRSTRRKIPLIDGHGSWISGAEPIVAGRWYRMPLKTSEVSECCDCGLVHITDYKIVEGRLFFRTTRAEEATTAARRRDGISLGRKK